MTTDAQEVEDQVVTKKEEQSTSDSELDTLRAELEKTRKEAADERAARQNVEREKTELTKTLTTETGNRLSAEEVAINNAIAAATSKAERLEREVVEAQENGKFSEAAKLTRQLASAQNEIDSWERQKSSFDQQREQHKNIQKQPDPLDSYTPATREWIRAHPRFLSDQVYNNRAMAAHYEAKSKGIPLDSAEYFQYIEDKAENRESNQDPEPQQKETHRAATRTAAPPSRGNSNSGMAKQGNNGEIKLTPQQVEAALISNPKLPPADAMKKYAESLSAHIANGKMTADGRYVE